GRGHSSEARSEAITSVTVYGSLCSIGGSQAWCLLLGRCRSPAPVTNGECFRPHQAAPCRLPGTPRARAQGPAKGRQRPGDSSFLRLRPPPSPRQPPSTRLSTCRLRNRRPRRGVGVRAVLAPFARA